MAEYTINELEKWDERIKEIVEAFGLDPFPQIFELCDHNRMIGYMSYSGMPARYPHWSFGKHYEKQKTLYDYGVAGLPYEMVINSDPCLAYLMSDNSLLLQILTMAHVYAHNDFFKNNFMFRQTNAEYTLEKFKTRADRLRRYIDDPNIGFLKVEEFLDAAHGLAMNCNRFKVINNQPVEKQEDLDIQNGEPPENGDWNLLLFIRDNNRMLTEWEKDLLNIVHEETLYFIPQIETKILNEGWAVYWHRKILEKLDLPQDLHMEFLVRHNQVVRPIPRSLNPYHIGFKLMEDIEKRWNDRSECERNTDKPNDMNGRQKIFQVRETDRDESFIRQYLTRELMEEMDLYQHETTGNERVVTKVASEQDWMDVRNTIIQNVGLNSIPVVKVWDDNHFGLGNLLLIHEFGGRELDWDYTEHTLKFVRHLWQKPVILESVQNSKKVHMTYDTEDKFEIREI